MSKVLNSDTPNECVTVDAQVELPRARGAVAMLNGQIELILLHEASVWEV